ncbi:uncharacterized protein LOC129919083 [Episyrphus balteatus]|uniref:uncharacterized protein LOC129919083 n=1 Tax=Episyrphus balteatus TaxID=286459 RepID=UPI002484FFC0|nr:uncharacterized protein LOC129919083 [Episyrphus balteatus]
MASASSSSARHLFGDSKKRLCERVSVNVNNIGSVARQVVRGSKTNEILAQSAKSLAQSESTMDTCAQNLRKMELIRQHVGYQCDAIKDSVNQLDYLQEQVSAMER